MHPPPDAKRPAPGGKRPSQDRRRQAKTTAQHVSSGESTTEVAGSRQAASVDPRQLVAAEPIEFLIEVLSDGHPFAVLDDAAGYRFVCPRCGWLGINGGSATLLDGWRWSCWRCRHTGTRLLVERLVLEDAVLLARFYRLINEREPAT